jgi:hypothetical protein
MHQGQFTTYGFEDPMNRGPTFDALETSQGRLLVAGASGVHETVVTSGEV